MTYFVLLFFNVFCGFVTSLALPLCSYFINVRLYIGQPNTVISVHSRVMKMTTTTMMTTTMTMVTRMKQKKSRPSTLQVQAQLQTQQSLSRLRRRSLVDGVPVKTWIPTTRERRSASGRSRTWTLEKCSRETEPSWQKMSPARMLTRRIKC